jgi:hypothetical protein
MALGEFDGFGDSESDEDSLVNVQSMFSDSK